MLPDALVIGPMRSGTSWIHDYLQARGDIALPGGVKETFFFDRYYEKGSSWYRRHFAYADRADYQCVAEVAPSYFHSESAPERVRNTLGDVPLVVTLRDPVRRAWSHYLHLRRYGYTRSSLREATDAFPEILEASRYGACLNRWQAVFGRHRLFVLWQEDLAVAPEAYTRGLCNGLGIEYFSPAGLLQQKRNEATLPRFPRLAAAGDRTAHFLRARRFYGVVNLAKRMGLKGVFFGRPGVNALPSLTDADAQWLASALDDAPPEWALALRGDSHGEVE
ncbi:sulfotransferase family protein [Tamilnaduibacter salinus]|uniref:Sulfotransferase family protein n=1 Tax=Tamilnaduibacter salinus TaxID=1484056 RepID=A0A2U1CUR0_9GAMM|nr:sulfotransferase [Tamilnaduibacter salinus]PVY70822.1 sulfotransferase family protein [Tamilnaduibacter salinus]